MIKFKDELLPKNKTENQTDETLLNKIKDKLSQDNNKAKKILSNASRLVATLSSIKELFTRTFDKNQLTKQRITILYNSST